MKILLVMLTLVTSVFIYACKSGGSSERNSTDEKQRAAYDAQKGKGKFSHVEVSDKIDPQMVATGERVYNVKCAACHKLTDEKLVGPGWKDVTTRRRPEWVMNFITNTDEMISEDPAAQTQLEICMVRMPNQNLSDDEARGIYEFMRKNDGVR